ncbi:beta-d-glucosyl crocetin beta-1 6-glucosyltransferase [Phtheirospermum japonicum]|uniref:Glycosyltransferase n=1 Tax=Phtheirospermum japonicum TaxID=374723 RepID=A0A830CSL7_9LAMI|nr:beta-d-glucosyl crocetin beta-1 6-glucosyltransferase [Phtheirospermum japonicum]
MFPWLGYGHITPYLELAKKLTARHDFKVYLCSTLATLTSIEHKITDTMSPSIKLVPILFPAFPDLPRKLHTTNGLPPNLMPRLKEAMLSLRTVSGFSDILSDLKPDLIIYDFLQPWLPSLARDHEIPAVQFVTSSCTATSVMCHYFKNPSGDVDFPFPEIRFRGYESGEMEERELVFKGLEGSNNIVLVKGFKEIESSYFDYASGLLGKRFLPVGPLVQEPGPNDREDLELLAWLDERKPKSTIFVSFGSEYFLTQADLDEIALGLELSGVSFIWVVRFPKDSPNGLLNETLPEGFLERVGGRGRVLEGWAPQAKILAHWNTGGFVSHCGWNSVLESMSFGVPIIALPMHLDQPTNARLVENVGVGVEVVRDEDGTLHGGTLAAVIKKVVVEDSGEFVRKTASIMRKKLILKGDEEIDQVRDELMALIRRS